MSEPLDPVVEPGQPDPAPAPQYVSVEDYKRLEATIAGQQELIQSINQNLTTLAARSQQTAPQPAAAAGADLTDEQIDAMVDDGRMTRAQAMRLIAKRETAELKKTDLDPFRAQGLTSLGSVVRELALPKMPHYQKYKAEIDKWIENLPDGAKLTPDAYVAAHNIVVGAHVNEIIESAREEAVRSATQTKPEPASSTARTGRTNATGTIPTVEELMGEKAADALASKGLTPDQFAKKLGYTDWKAYAELEIKARQGVA